MEQIVKLKMLLPMASLQLRGTYQNIPTLACTYILSTTVLIVLDFYFQNVSRKDFIFKRMHYECLEEEESW